MKIRTELVSIPKADFLRAFPENTDVIIQAHSPANALVLSWGGVAATDDFLHVSVASLYGSQASDRLFSRTNAEKRVQTSLSDEQSIVLIFPTGVGASRGGYIGDASPIVRLFESVFDLVITNPNSVNAADHYGCDTSWYTEGSILDDFLRGRLLLDASQKMRVGVILDDVPRSNEIDIINTLNAAQAVFGIDIVGYSVLDSALSAKSIRSDYGHFIGEVENPENLLRASENLISGGATSIAIVSNVEGVSKKAWNDHYLHNGVNPIGAVESLISRFISYMTGLPSAHAPAYVEGLGGVDKIVDPRASAEVISRTGLMSVLRGLANSPYPNMDAGKYSKDINAVVVPASCSIGVPLTAALTQDIPIILVRDNECSVGIDASSLPIRGLSVVDSYTDAMSWILAKRAGLTWSSLHGKTEPVKAL